MTKKKVTIILIVFLAVGSFFSTCGISKTWHDRTVFASFQNITASHSKRRDLTKSFSEMYSDYYHLLYDDSLHMLKEIYLDYGIEIRWDLKEFGDGSYNKHVVMLPKKMYNQAVEEVYDFLMFMRESGFADLVMANSISQISLIYNMKDEYEDVLGLNISYYNDIAVTFYSGSPRSRLATFAEESSDLIFTNYKLDLEPFRSHNGPIFEKYNEELKEEDVSFAKKVIDADDNDAFGREHLENGFLTTSALDEVYDDMNEYFRGLLLNDISFWYKYDSDPDTKGFDSTIVQLKTQAIIDELIKINPDFSLEYFRTMSHPDYHLLPEIAPRTQEGKAIGEDESEELAITTLGYSFDLPRESSPNILIDKDMSTAWVIDWTEEENSRWISFELSSKSILEPIIIKSITLAGLKDYPLPEKILVNINSVNEFYLLTDSTEEIQCFPVPDIVIWGNYNSVIRLKAERTASEDEKQIQSIAEVWFNIE